MMLPGANITDGLKIGSDGDGSDGGGGGGGGGDSNWACAAVDKNIANIISKIALLLRFFILKNVLEPKLGSR